MAEKFIDEAVSIEPIVIKPEARDALVARESQMDSLYQEMNTSPDEPIENTLRTQLRFIAANLALNNNDFGQESKPLTWEEYTEKVETDIVGAKFKHMKEIDSDRETLHQESLARDAFEETRAYATRA